MHKGIICFDTSHSHSHWSFLISLKCWKSSFLISFDNFNVFISRLPDLNQIHSLIVTLLNDNSIFTILQKFCFIRACLLLSPSCVFLTCFSTSTSLNLRLSKEGSQLVNSKNVNEETPLHVAARVGNREAAMLLIQNGALVTSTDANLRTPLHYAAKNGHLEIVQILLDNNSEVKIFDFVLFCFWNWCLLMWWLLFDLNKRST